MGGRSQNPDIDSIVTERGESYGHPAAHFARTVAILGVVFGETRISDLRVEDWPVMMICDKLARFAESRDHEDSVADIEGYARTWFMAREG